MAQKTEPKDRIGVIERVTTPLGFFTLGILVIEGILASLSVRATGVDVTILIVGMLVGFGLLCSMVFVLAVFPQFRSALLGIADYSPSGAIAQMNLTPNDIRVIYDAYGNHSQLNEPNASRVLLGDAPLPWDQRSRKLYNLGLIGPSEYGRRGEMLTKEGKALAGLIAQFSKPLLELQKVGKLEETRR